MSHLNVRSLVLKFDEVKILLESPSRQCMVVGMSKTWLDE